MVQKRKGSGGNTSRDPRGNLAAQGKYLKKHGTQTKKCNGMFHHDLGPIDISNFSQQKGNKGTGLQALCTLCNRLYFKLRQKPIARMLSYVIYADANQIDWTSDCPDSIKEAFKSAVDFWNNNKCQIPGCTTKTKHGDLRQVRDHLNELLIGIEKKSRTIEYIDKETKRKLKISKELNDLYNWDKDIFATEGMGKTVWAHWCSAFPHDTAQDSTERNAVKSGEMSPPVPEHPLIEFSWGAGNFLLTSNGHTVPGFNKVLASYSNLKNASGNSRPYGFLVEGDRVAMAKKSREFKEAGLTLGHSPAPLRWLGKDDPVNAVGQTFDENVELNDSLVDLHAAALADPAGASNFVSWQISEVVKELGESQVSLEVFIATVQDRVETYFDSLHAEISKGKSKTLRMHIEKADPGQTEKMYIRREEKVKKWLAERPNAKKKATKKLP